MTYTTTMSMTKDCKENDYKEEEEEEVEEKEVGPTEKYFQVPKARRAPMTMNT